MPAPAGRWQVGRLFPFKWIHGERENVEQSELARLAGEKLAARFSPERLEIIDDSGRHAGHKSAGGGGHLRVLIVASDFEGMNTLQRHRAVYDALGEEMRSGRLHALAITAAAPGEPVPA